MPCIKCGVDKLSNEFPPTSLMEDCDHPSSLICLRCVLSHVGKTNCCPYPDCDQKVTSENKNIQMFKAILDHMFTEYATETTPTVVCSEAMTSVLNITVLNGESMQVPYKPSMTIQELKRQIQIKLNHEVGRQKLLYQEKELQTYKNTGEHAHLSDYNVKPNSTVYLVILLYSIPEKFDHVVFDLYWGYPVSGRDYLDASCLTFSGTSYLNVVDYRRRSHSEIRHSGDVMDNSARIGHHTINVRLKAIPTNVTHLFFTLSAWNSPNIARYPNPSLKFYEASKPGTDLCKTTFNHARNSQAVVMCSVSRNSRGCWEIFQLGQLSAGNAKNYNPLITTIRQLISQGF